MPVGLRFLILAACVPLLIPPGVCTCGAADRVQQSASGVAMPSAPASGGHRHKHDDSEHPHSCFCLGELGLDEDDGVQPAAPFVLDIPAPVTFSPPPIAVPAVPIPVETVLPVSLPRFLTHLALLI